MTQTPALSELTLRELSATAQEPAWLLERRLAAWRAYQAMALPDPLEEEWRRTDISELDLAAALAARPLEHTSLPNDGTRMQEYGAVVAVSPEGRAYWAHNGDLKGAVFSDLHLAAREHEDVVRQHLHTLVRSDEWKLAALQAAAWRGGAFLYVPRGVELELPLCHFVTAAGAPVFPHLLVVAEANSSVTLVQESSSADSGSQSLVSGAVEIIARQDARVRFVDLQGWGNHAYSFQTIRARLERGAELSAALVGLGSRLNRTRLEVELAGEGARAELLGLSHGSGAQHFDYVTLQDHVAPRTTSDLLFKAALTGAASEVWSGTVRIQKGASASDAAQASRNLLLSDEARAAPIPVLEIEAYDILRCSHGASAGPLDEEQRFYLESRGIPPAEAQQLLVDAFFQEVIDRLPEGPIRERSAAALAAKIGR
jgi:Fe-S cluster assembly protein SufD